MKENNDDDEIRRITRPQRGTNECNDERRRQAFFYSVCVIDDDRDL